MLAEAGLRRLELAERITQVLPPEIMLPAIGQGALGLETRTEDQPTRTVLDGLNHSPTHAGVLAERTMLTVLEGGCLAPIAAWGRVDGQVLTLSGRVLAADGSRRLDATMTGKPQAAPASFTKLGPKGAKAAPPPRTGTTRTRSSGPQEIEPEAHESSDTSGVVRRSTKKTSKKKTTKKRTITGSGSTE